MALTPYYDRLLGALREADASGGGGSTTLAVQDFQAEQASATVTYQGIVAAGTSTATASWSLLKLVLSGNDRESRAVYTATDSWDNRASATYSLSNTYSY